MPTDPKHARQIVARGVSAWEREDFESALQTFQSVLKDHASFADVQNKAGLCLAMLGRLEEALNHFDAALELNASYAEAHLNRGIILNDLGRHEEAQEAFAKAGEIETRDSRVFPSEVGNRIAVTHAQLGDLYLVADHPSNAIEHYRAALEIRPRFMDIRSKFAETLMELGELEQAREELTLILESRPSFVGARIRLGVVLNRLGEDEEAMKQWKRCLEDDPRDMRARAYLASVESTAEGLGD
ncbi:MAG: tetratricopeptide repeat protein [Gemmatimonadetes bacterium]|nr:tetratricopeptide repeat protein [Gemmatimonadota bacterium]NNF12631.1 tetratricopeptide repeat protein [Gemmatimonadota bacterium]